MKPYILYPIVLLMIFLNSCQDDEGSFGNAVYFNSASTAKVTEFFNKGNQSETSYRLESAISKPEDYPVTITYRVDLSLVDQYNHIYAEHALKLPSNHYELIEPKSEIPPGNVLTGQTMVRFKNLENLDREPVYVLPITIADANIPILGSAATRYFVIKGGALINVVADIEENYLSVDWAKPEVVNSLSKLTMEALIRARNFNGQDAGINTVMGIEGKFLIRIGDGGGYPANQIQISTSEGSFPDADENKGLPTNQWIHIAVTYDSNDGTMIIYVNGKEQSKGIKNVGSVDLGIGGKNGFYIGRSFSDDRWFAGEISECRIWNVVRTPEEIASHPYAVDPDTEGLAAYWKFDEAAGKGVKDHTANGNDAKANKSLKWTKVSLPPS